MIPIGALIKLNLIGILLLAITIFYAVVSPSTGIPTCSSMGFVGIIGLSILIKKGFDRFP